MRLTAPVHLLARLYFHSLFNMAFVEEVINSLHCNRWFAALLLVQGYLTHNCFMQYCSI